MTLDQALARLNAHIGPDVHIEPTCEGWRITVAVHETSTHVDIGDLLAYATEHCWPQHLAPLLYEVVRARHLLSRHAVREPVSLQWSANGRGGIFQQSPFVTYDNQE